MELLQLSVVIKEPNRELAEVVATQVPARAHVRTHTFVPPLS